MDWLREIELDEYAQALQGSGINGPVVVSLITVLTRHFHHDLMMGVVYNYDKSYDLALVHFKISSLSYRLLSLALHTSQ